MSLDAYNVKVRKHQNGLVEYRVYEKAVQTGIVPKNLLKRQNYNTSVAVDIPFLDKPLKMENYVSEYGWQKAKKREMRSIQNSVKRTKDAIFDYSNATCWKWFCTFTFSQKCVERDNFCAVSKKMTSWLRNMRQRYCPDMKYVLVPERHRDGSWHFHGLFADCDGFNFVPALNNKEFYRGKLNKQYLKPLKRKGQQVYNLSNFKLGFTDCTEVKDTKKVANYILKYITKELCVDTPGRKRYWCSQNLKKPSEETFVTDIEFCSFVETLLCECLEKNPDTYCNTFEVEHGDFHNTISYIYC